MTPREFWLRLTFPFRRGQLARELREEIELHLALRAERLRATGMAPAEADAAARRRFGNRSRLLGAAREAWGWHWLDGFGQDLRYVGRQLRGSPGFALVTLLTIALGVAINTTAFTFYDAVVLKPLPVRDPARVLRVVQDRNIPNPEELPFSAYEVLRRDAHAIQSIVTTTGPQSLSVVLPGRAPEDARLVSGRFVSPDFFAVLGVRPRLGRWPDAGEPEVALDHAYWTNQLAADPTILGRPIAVGGRRLTVVGIAPAEFAGTGLPALAPELWLPMSLMPALLPGGDWRYDARPHWQVLGRAAPDASLEQARSELASLERGILDTAGTQLPLVVRHATFFQSDAGEFDVFREVSAALMVALGLILAIGIVNLVHLLVARNAARQREIAVRLALGASRTRIARQLASESLLLALTGGALGLVASGWAATWLRAWIVGTMASVSGGLAAVSLDIRLDRRIAAYAILLSCGIGLCVGLWPALRAARADAITLLRQGTTSTSGIGAERRRNVLLVLQIAASVILLTSSGMLLGGLRFAREIDPGFDARHMIVVDLFDGRVPGSRRAAMRAEVGRRLAALPDVRAVAWTRRVPFGGTHLRRVTSGNGPLSISIDDVSESYLDAMGVSIRRGRTFTRTEVESGAPLMLVSASLARLRWRGQDPIGQSVPPGDVLVGPDSTRSYTVIGIVPDLRTNFLSRVNGPSTYYPHNYRDDFGSFLVRTRGTPEAAINAVRVTAQGVVGTAGGETRVITMEGGPMAIQRVFAEAPATASLLLAMVGLLLASVGVYGLISQIVARRTREIGIHMALGARAAQVIGLVMRDTLRPVAWGAVVGGAGALAVSTLLHALIATPDAPDLTFGAGAFNPMIFAGVVVVLGCVVLLACFAPARRAARLDPTLALRVD